MLCIVNFCFFFTLFTFLRIELLRFVFSRSAFLYFASLRIAFLCFVSSHFALLTLLCFLLQCVVFLCLKLRLIVQLSFCISTFRILHYFISIFCINMFRIPTFSTVTFRVPVFLIATLFIATLRFILFFFTLLCFITLCLALLCFVPNFIFCFAFLRLSSLLAYFFLLLSYEAQEKSILSPLYSLGHQSVFNYLRHLRTKFRFRREIGGMHVNAGNRVPASCQPSSTWTTTSSSCIPIMQSSRISDAWNRERMCVARLWPAIKHAT